MQAPQSRAGNCTFPSGLRVNWTKVELKYLLQIAPIANKGPLIDGAKGLISLSIYLSHLEGSISLRVTISPLVKEI